MRCPLCYGEGKFTPCFWSKQCSRYRLCSDIHKGKLPPLCFRAWSIEERLERSVEM